MISRAKADEASRLLGQGNSHHQIAYEMCVAEATVRRYLRHAKELSSPRVLFIDIETAPLEVYSWGIRKQHLQHFQIKEEWFILSWAAKWLLEDGVFSDCVTPQEAVLKEDGRILKGIHDLLETAHIVVAHNALRFDIRKLNYRFITYGYIKPSPYQVVDTLKQAQKHLAASSHKLDHLTKTFGLSQKDDTDFSLWVDCCNGDKKALDYMLKYNISDISALEGLYLYLRPWITSHPNIALYTDVDGKVCASCGSCELNWNINEYFTPAGKFKAARCMDCGAISRSRFSSISPEKRQCLTLPAAR